MWFAGSDAMKLSTVLGAGVSAAALLLIPVNPAFAQDAAAPQDEAPAEDGDIVVMAQGR